jgi:hypothetical protein
MNKIYAVHNVVWNWHHGLVPDGLSVDHRDRDKENNYISNFRLATPSQQRLNQGKRKYKSGGECPGVTWHKNARKWQARKIVDGKLRHVGYFTDKIEAKQALLNSK